MCISCLILAQDRTPVFRDGGGSYPAAGCSRGRTAEEEGDYGTEATARGFPTYVVAGTVVPRQFSLVKKRLFDALR